MKKIILLAAVAALAMTSCSNDQAIQGPNNSGDAISFKPLGTKATETTTLNIDNFKIFAYYDALAVTNPSTPDWTDLNYAYMNGQYVNRIKKVDDPDNWDNWKYTPVKYWPTEGMLHFFAYSPSTSVVTFSGANEAPAIIGYTVPANTAAQKDFIVASAVDQERWGVPAGQKDAVSLSFSHALSQVAFMAKNGDPSLSFSITSIDVMYVNNTGTYSFTGTPGWSARSGAEVYQADLNATAEAITPSVTTYQDLTDAVKGPLMLLPQPLTAVDLTDIEDYEDDLTSRPGSYLRIVFTATDANEPTITFPNIVRIIPLEGEWVKGKKYIYQLTLRGSGGGSITDLDPIVFSNITVIDWETPVTNPAEYPIIPEL